MPQSKKSETSSRPVKGAKPQAAGGNFEDRLRRLEDLSEALKDGELPLEEAVKKFEEGVRLARGLEKDLSRIERRVEILITNPETLTSPETEKEKPEPELFPELNEDA